MHLLLRLICLCLVGVAAEPDPWGQAEPLLKFAGIQARSDRPQELREPFTSVTGVRELSDGTVLVVDAGERRVVLADFQTQQVTPVAREGRGPGEYMGPRLIFALRKDSAAVFDQRLWRFLYIDGSRPQSRTLPFPAASFEQIRGVDEAGRVYYEGTAVAGAGREAADSLPILRHDPRADRTDTIALIAAPRRRPEAELGGVVVSGFSGPFSAYGPFAGGDDWTVLADGSIAVVRANPYAVAWILPDGQRPPALPVPYQTVPVTEADKQAYQARYREARLVLPGGSDGSRTIRPRFDISWPTVKPPFEKGQVLSGPSGQVWVGRSQPAGSDSQVFDIFARGGARVGTVSVAPGYRLLGFGTLGAYLVREDHDGLQYLVRQPFRYQGR